MKYASFKHDGKKVSRFGLGCMRFPTRKTADGKEEIDEDEAIRMVRHAIDCGVNYIDTAFLYAGSERVVGKALLDGYREKVILATKLPVGMAKTEADLESFYRKELERLQTDHIDVYFLHNLGIKNWENAVRLNAFDFMKRLKDEGKISYIAVSVHGTLEHWKKVLDTYPWDLCMMQHNYYDRFHQMGEEGLRYAAARGIPVVIMESLHGGMLAQGVPDAVRKAFGDWRPELSDAERSLMWLINKPEPAVMLSGVSRMEQLEENLRVFDTYGVGCLTEEENALYDRAREAWKTVVKVPCTGCRYCMPCPQGVDIPDIFEVYNNLARVSDPERAQKWLYPQVIADAGRGADKCVKCGKCERQCPQEIKIIEELQNAHTALMD